MELQTMVQEYVGCLVGRGCSETHVASVRLRLGRFVAGRERAPVDGVTEEQVAAHFAGLAEAGLAMGTLAGHKSTLRAFWNWAVDQGHVARSPAQVLATKAHRYSFEPVNNQPAPAQDFETMVLAIGPFAAHRSYQPRDVRDALAVSLAVDSSARRGEIWALRRADMERALERAQPALPGRLVYRALVGGKTGATAVRFFDETAALARRWLALMPAGTVWLFCSLRSGARLRRDYMGQAFKRLCKFAGVPTFRFQAVRKRTVMDAISLTGDPTIGQRLAGHKDARTTAVYYNLVQEEEVAAAGARLATARRGRPEADGEALARALFGGVGGDGTE